MIKELNRTTRMSAEKASYIAILGENKFDILQLILCAWSKGLKILTISSSALEKIKGRLNAVFFLKDYLDRSIVEQDVTFDSHKGLLYKLSELTIDLTVKFYDSYLKNSSIINSYNNRFNTSKFEAYIKKTISVQIFSLLKEFYFLRDIESDAKRVLVIRNKISEFVVKSFDERFNIDYEIVWINPKLGIFILFSYYGWLFKECMRRGFVFNKLKSAYKISREAAWGFYNKTLRDDILIDGEKFKKEDILILNFYKKPDKSRLGAYRDSQKRGFPTVSVPNLKINITRNIADIIYLYFWMPFVTYCKLFFKKQLYLCEYMFLFHQQSFPIELLMTLHNIKCHISISDGGDVALTIIMNKYGTKNTIFHWSDLTAFKDYNYAFIAHNFYFVWGDIHYDYHCKNYFVDKKVAVGCIFKEACARAAEGREYIIAQINNLNRNRRIVTFFDTSFSESFQYTGNFLIEYLNVINDYCKINKEVNILLKPKLEGTYDEKITKDYYAKFKKVWEALNACDNFIYLDPIKWSIEEIIVISDVCVSMGMNSPSTIALICGKDALYFDNTGNNSHPFAKKYKNIIMFEDKDALFRQIDNTLNEKFSCRDVINEKELREYDAFADNNALGRLINNLYELTST